MTDRELGFELAKLLDVALPHFRALADREGVTLGSGPGRGIESVLVMSSGGMPGPPSTTRKPAALGTSRTRVARACAASGHCITVP